LPSPTSQPGSSATPKGAGLTEAGWLARFGFCLQAEAAAGFTEGQWGGERAAKIVISPKLSLDIPLGFGKLSGSPLLAVTAP
jgi:hypothetical protein